MGAGRGPGSRPKATIPNAIGATTLTQRSVYVSQGTFTGPITLSNGVSLYGGYDASEGWSRAADHTTTILGSGGRGVTARNINQRTVLDRFQILAGNANSAGASSRVEVGAPT